MISIRILNNNENIDLKYFESFESLGFFMMLTKSEGVLIKIVDIEKKYNISVEKVKELLINLTSKNLISTFSETIEDEIIINIEFPKLKNNLNNDYEILVDAFGINVDQINELKHLSLIDNEIDSSIFKRNFISLITRINLPIIEKEFIINNEKEFLEYLNSVYIKNIFVEKNCVLSSKDVEFFYDLLLVQKIPKDMINLLVDYTINTNIYLTFNQKFAEKVVLNWIKNDIKEAKEALIHIKKLKEKISEKSRNNKYVEPVFDPIDIDNNLPTDKEIEDLINNGYNR